MSAPQTPTAMGEKEFIALMATLMAMVAFAIDTILPALSRIAHDMDVAHSNQRQYLLITVFIGINMGTFVFGPLSDAIGRKLPILIGGTLFVLGGSIGIITHDFDIMLLGRLLQGFGISAMQVISIAIIRDKYTGDAMARIQSFVMTMFITAPSIAPLIGQIIVSQGHWRFIFVFLVVIGLLGVAWFWLRQGETLPPTRRIPFNLTTFVDGVKQVMTHCITLPYAIASGFLFGAFVGYLVSSQQILQDIYQVADLFPLYFALLALSFGGATFINGTLVQRVGMRKLCHGGLISIWGISILMLLSLWITQQTTLPLWAFIGVLCVYFFCEGLSFGNINAIAMEPMGHIAGIATSVIGFIRGAVGIATGYVVGKSFDGTTLPLFIGLFIAPTLSILLVMYSNKRLNILR